MNDLKVTRTTYEVDGIKEPCIIVSDGYTQVRISTCYHYIGPNTLYVSEFLGDDFNGTDEVIGDFNLLSDFDAIEIAKECSAYIR